MAVAIGNVGAMARLDLALDLTLLHLHDRTHGLLRIKEKEAILLHLETLSLSDHNDLPEESRFLLEFDIGSLKQADYDTQCYWVAAVTAARIAILGNDSACRQDTVIRTQPSWEPRQSDRHRHGAGRTSVPSSTPSRDRPSPGAPFAQEASNKNKKPD